MKVRWIGLCVSLCLTMVVVAQEIDVTGSAEPLEHYWSYGVGAGRANEGLRCGWHEQLKEVKDNCGFRYVRMHDVFDDDMVPSIRNADNYMNASSKEIDITLTHLASGAIFEVETMDNNHGNAYGVYEKMGKPHSPTIAETTLLKEQAWATQKETITAD